MKVYNMKISGDILNVRSWTLDIVELACMFSSNINTLRVQFTFTVLATFKYRLSALKWKLNTLFQHARKNKFDYPEVLNAYVIHEAKVCNLMTCLRDS